MPPVYTRVIQRKAPEDQRETPLVTVRRVTTAAGAADGSTLIDDFLADLTDDPVGLTIVLRPDDPLNFEVKQVSAFIALTGTVTPGTVFAAQVGAGVPYAIGGSGNAVAAAVGLLPAADAVANLTSADVIGNKTDTAQQTVGATSSLMRYVKALKTNDGDPSGHTLVTWTAKWGNLAQSFASWAGDQSAHALTSIAAKWGNMTETLLVVLGARADAAVQTTADASMHARLKGLLTSAGNPSGDTLVSLTAKLGNLARSLTTILGTRWDAAGDLGTDIAALLASRNRELYSVDYWSIPKLSVVIPSVAADQTLPDVVVADLPAGITVVKATAIFKARSISNAGAANKLSGAQQIQIQAGGAGGFVDAIDFVDDQFTVAAAAVDAPGDVVIGLINVVAKVTGNATYNFQWDEAVADVANLTFNDVQIGLRVWYSV